MVIPSFEIPLWYFYVLGVFAYLAMAVLFGGLLTYFGDEDIRQGSMKGSGLVLASLLFPVLLVYFGFCGVVFSICKFLGIMH